MLTCNSILPFGTWSGPAWDIAVLAHDERHLRRKVIRLVHGDEVLIDLEKAVALQHGDALHLSNGKLVEIVAAEEDLLEIIPHDATHLAQLCWHIGNRHLAAQIEDKRILVLSDHVIKAMLEGLGAHVHHVSEPFHPMSGAYSGHGGHGHGHGSEGGHSHD